MVKARKSVLLETSNGTTEQKVKRQAARKRRLEVGISWRWKDPFES